MNPEPIYSPEQLTELFKARTGQDAAWISYAPGRFNVIGEHTDYNGGLALPAATPQRIITILSRNPSYDILFHSEAYNEQFLFESGETVNPKQSWQKYAWGCTKLFQQHSGIQQGFTALITGDLPAGFGISSSAALCVSILKGLSALFQYHLGGKEICKMAQRVENEFVHLPCGQLDFMASVYSEEERFLLIDFGNESHRTIPSRLESASWILLNSGVKRELAEKGYADRVRETREAFEHIRNKFPYVESLRHCNAQQRLTLLDDEEVLLYERVMHFANENRRVRKAEQAIVKGDAFALGQLMNDSHYSLREFYHVSCEELDFLQAQAESLGPCFGSRMMGGGFGGCTINLVDTAFREAFIETLHSRYKERFGRALQAIELKPSAGASVLSLTR